MHFGFAVGLAELPADAWLVQATGTLDYSIRDGPTICRSPAWMPLAWEMVAVQFGYLGMRLHEWRRGWGLLLAGAIGAVNIPFYEVMALRTHWWRYVDCRMLLHTPYYIVVGEFLIVVAIGYLARWTGPGGGRARSWRACWRGWRSSPAMASATGRSKHGGRRNRDQDDTRL